MQSESSKSKTLGAFLKSRRNRLQPEQAGFTHSYGQRRTPGLRREEVAMLAGVSVTYYTWLEQGREVTASREIIESIGKALQLTPDEGRHLLQLWNPNEPNEVSSINTTLNPQWQNIIGQLSYPSFITNPRTEVLAWNDAANMTIADFSTMTSSERVMIRILFLDPQLRLRVVNWEEFASYSVAVFRTYYDKHQEDPWFDETVDKLCKESAEFETLWKLHHIQLKKVSRVHFQIPGAAEVDTYDINSFGSLTDHPELLFCVYTPLVGDDTEIHIQK